MPERAESGERYEITIRFTPDVAVVTGFQLLVVSDNSSNGLLSSEDGSIECLGAAARSIRPAGKQGEWRLAWHAPATLNSPVTFHLAAMGGNDDGSPLGDQVWFRSVTLSM